MASLIYTKAPQIIRAFDEDAVIRSRRGRFLAIPTDNAPRKGTDGKRISPSTFPEHRFGPLRFVPRPSGPSLLVVDGLRASFSRKTGELRGFRRSTERARQRGQGLTTVVMFLLVPQVKLCKRLDVGRAAEHWSAQLPALTLTARNEAMPASKAEQVLDALKSLLETVPDAVVERNSVLPERIPDGGLIILRDGEPDEPEQALGGFGNAYYQHGVEIEVYVEEGDAAERDAAFDILLQQIGAALEADLALGGLVFSLTYGRPEPATEAVAGAPAIKSATLTVTVEYETGAPLA